ncbi:unnamed protein product, partial [Symbiodinium microadriaticum]
MRIQAASWCMHAMSRHCPHDVPSFRWSWRNSDWSVPLWRFLDPSTEALVLLSGSCLPLQRLHELYDIFLEGYCQGRSVLKYHFMKGGQQRVLGVPLGALQWKLWHRRELQILAALDEAELRRRWEPLEATMQRYGLAPDE